MARGRRTYPHCVSAATTDPEPMIVQLQTGERIHYLDWAGGPGIPIVLIHGLTRTAWTWLPVARRLVATHPLVAPDLRGHGGSDAPLKGYVGGAMEKKQHKKRLALSRRHDTRSSPWHSTHEPATKTRIFVDHANRQHYPT